MKPTSRITRSQSRNSLQNNYARLKKKQKVVLQYLSSESDDESVKFLGESSGKGFEPIEISQAAKMSSEDTSSSGESIPILISSVDESSEETSTSEESRFVPFDISLAECERPQKGNNEDTSSSSGTHKVEIHEIHELEIHNKNRSKKQKTSYRARKGKGRPKGKKKEVKETEAELTKAKEKGKTKTNVVPRGRIKTMLSKGKAKGKAKKNVAPRGRIRSVLSKGKSKIQPTASISKPCFSSSSSDSLSDDDDSEDSDFHDFNAELSSPLDNSDGGNNQAPEEESEKKMSYLNRPSRKRKIVFPHVDSETKMSNLNHPSRKRKIVFSDVDSEAETHIPSKHELTGTSSGNKFEREKMLKNIVSSTSSCSKIKKTTMFNAKRKVDFSGNDSEVDDTKTLKELFSPKCMPREQEKKKESVFENSCNESVFEANNEIRNVEIKKMKEVEQFTREEEKKSSRAYEVKKCDPSAPKDISDEICSKIREVEGLKLKTAEKATHEEEKRCLSATEIKKCTEGTKKKQQKTINMDMCRILVDSVLNQKSIVDEDAIDHNAPTVPKFRLPLKFRFEEEVPKPVEKSEHELENERLFAILEASYYGEEIDYSSGQEEVGDGNMKENSSEAENIEDNEGMNSFDSETSDQSVKCLKGEHDLKLDEQIGWVCIHCLHVDIAAKDILPELVERTAQRRHARIRYPITKEQDEQPLRAATEGFNFTPGENSSSTHSSNPGEGTVWDIKPDLRRTMHEHQQEGFEFLWKNLAGSIKCSELSNKNVGGCIISHAPGTGKTRLTIEFIHTYLKMFPNCRPLIIAPANMLLTWEEELKKWGVEFPFHNLGTPGFSGKENTRVLQKVPKSANQNTDVVRMVKMYSWNEEQSVLGMSYNLFTLLVGEEKEDRRKGDILDQTDPYQVIRNIILEKPGLVVLDEGHIPRNNESRIWNAIQGIRTSKRIILSGTPFQNNFEELFDVFYIVRPSTAEKLGKDKRFSEIVRKKKSEVPECAIEELKNVMAPFVHIHRGTILKKKLPGLIECVILLNPRSLQKNLIERLQLTGNSFIHDGKVALTSTHPYLFQFCKLTEQECLGVDNDALDVVQLNPDEGVKTRFVMELVRLSMARNEKVLIFSQYIRPLQLMKDHLQKTFDNFFVGKQILTIIGETSQKTRQDLINSFNDPLSQSKVLLASKNCCAEGINLIGASRVVLLDVSWNPSVQRQAISRAYRLGQNKIVYTYHLMANGTNEGEKFCYQAEKERLSELVFASSEENWEVKKNHILEDDIILKAMTTDAKLKDMFADIIYEPNKKNLVKTQCLES